MAAATHVAEIGRFPMRAVAAAVSVLTCSEFWDHPLREFLPRPPRRPAANARTPNVTVAVRSAASLDASSGSYWSKSKARTPSGAAQDAALAERLWARSVEATGVGA